MDDHLITPAVVIDNGSGVIKAGFAGDNKPSVTIPAYIGRPKYPRLIGLAKASNKPIVGNLTELSLGLLKLKYPMEHGVVVDWSDAELIWRAVYEKLNTKPTTQALLITESAMNPRSNTEKLLSIFFDEFNVPACFISAQASLALYASGRTNGLVLDAGDGVCQISPILEGFCLNHSLRTMDLGGRDITNYLSLLLRGAGKVFHSSAEMEIVKNIKESACYVSYSPLKDEFERSMTTRESNVVYGYTLPDGSAIQLSNERCKAPELLFNPQLLGYEYSGVHHLVASSLSRTDVDLRRELAAQIILSGGSTMFNGFVDRLMAELRRLQPKDSLIRIYASPDRSNATFCGGSILASLSAFKRLYISKSDYEENGAACLHRSYM